MISDTTGPMDRELTPGQGRLRASANCWLSLAAAPTFAIMALLTEIHDGSTLTMLCSATRETSPLTGMIPMYLLMSTFHLSPWLKLLFARR
jgi:hypothetical protein